MKVTTAESCAVYHGKVGSQLISIGGRIYVLGSHISHISQIPPLPTCLPRPSSLKHQLYRHWRALAGTELWGIHGPNRAETQPNRVLQSVQAAS